MATFRKFNKDKTKVILAKNLVEGMALRDIADLLYFTCAPGTHSRDKSRSDRAVNDLRSLMKDPDWKDIHKNVLVGLATPSYDKAMLRLIEQIDSDQPWLANKAANDVIAQMKPLVLGDEDKSVTIRVEGMPDLGVPDGDE